MDIKEEHFPSNYHMCQVQNMIPPYIIPSDFGKGDDQAEIQLLNDKNFKRIRVYLDLLQYTSEE